MAARRGEGDVGAGALVRRGDAEPLLAGVGMSERVSPKLRDN